MKKLIGYKFKNGYNKLLKYILAVCLLAIVGFNINVAFTTPLEANTVQSSVITPQDACGLGCTGDGACGACWYTSGGVTIWKLDIGQPITVTA